MRAKLLGALFMAQLASGVNVVQATTYLYTINAWADTYEPAGPNNFITGSFTMDGLEPSGTVFGSTSISNVRPSPSVCARAAI